MKAGWLFCMLLALGGSGCFYDLTALGPRPDAAPDTNQAEAPGVSETKSDAATEVPVDAGQGADRSDAPEAPDASSTEVAPALVHGLRGDYYNGEDFDCFVTSRLDRRIFWTWAETNAVPAPGVPEDHFSVRWTGFIEARYTETYTFLAVADDGLRLWINDTAVIDAWFLQSQVEHTGTIDMIAGERVPIRVELFDGAFSAVAELSWSSNRQREEPVPESQLWTPPVPDPPPQVCDGGTAGADGGTADADGGTAGSD